MKVVLDTNVFVSGIFWPGPASRILELWAKDKIKIVISPAILTEYQRVLTEIGRERSSGLADQWAVLIAQHATLIYPANHPPLCRDPHDDKFLHCALSAGARIIVSGDKDLLTLNRMVDIDILTPAAFLQRYKHAD